MRKRRTQGQQAAASGAFLWVVFYAFRSLFRRGLDNLSRLPADHAGKALIFMDIYSPKCVDRKYLFRCRLASFFRRMAASGYSLYLHSIIHISCLVFCGRMKYNKKCYRSMNVGSVWLLPTNTETLADWHRKKCGDECDKNSNM